MKTKTLNGKLIFGMILIGMIICSGTVFADHTATVTISPDIANCNELGNTFTVTVTNNAGSADNILQVEIYKALTGISSFTCGPAPSGWTLFEYTDRCIYVTGLNSQDKIGPGESLDFTFDAVMSSDSCTSDFIVVSVDDAEPTGDRVTNTVSVSIDCSAPVITKTVGDPKLPGVGFDWWITQDTNINVLAKDSKDDNACNLGLDYCRYTYTVDGNPDPDFATECEGFGGTYDDGWCVFKNGETLNFNFKFNEDSEHEIKIECYDVAGNKAEINEIDKVDSTPPETTKTVGEPKKIEDGVEWVDTVTEITFTSNDPDSTGHDCNIGVDKIWYKNVIGPTEESCWDPQTYCTVGCMTSPYDEEKYDGCIDECQELCSEKYTPNTDPWYDCVEGCSYENCEVDENWKLYRGVPINKDQESCHILYYFSVDKLGNIEPMQVNCFFVDKTPPLVSKEHGTPLVEDEGFDWVTPETDITFTCTDQEPHPSGDEELCFKVSYDLDPDGYNTDGYCTKYGGTMENGWCCVPATPNAPFVFNFNENEDSYHDLEYFCRDAVEKSSEPQIQYYKVDSVPPTITKEMIGDDHIGQCPPQNEEDKCYVRDDCENGVHIAVEDGGEICAVDQVSCDYELWWESTSEECEEAGGQYVEGWCLLEYGNFGEEGQDIIFHKDSTHKLIVKCEDALGNEMEEDVEYFLVDSTPPVTTKTYGEPTKVKEGYRWISSDTPITLTAEDEKVGVEKIIYRVTNVGDYLCPEKCEETGSGDWIEVTGSSTEFTISDESCHYIEFYSVDKLGNIEEVKSQCVMVDNTAPKSVKEHGTPLVEDEGFDWVTQETPITLDCVDSGPHPVDQETLCYKVSYDQPEYPTYITEKYCEEFGGDYNEATGYCCVYVGDDKRENKYTFHFLEDSYHDLEYYCVDHLGNTEEPVNIQYYKVDSVPPSVTKVMNGPYYGQCPPVNECDVCYVDTATNISLEIEDGGEICAVDNVQCHWRYRVNGGGWSDWFTTIPITFPEECYHELEIECWDKLGNTWHDIERFIVDKTPPIVSAQTGKPKIPCEEGEGCDYWIRDHVTEITLSCYDPDPHPSGVKKIEYRWKLDDGEWTDWIEYTEPIIFEEDSVHYLEYRCIDNVGKVRYGPGKVYKVDSTPPETTKTYTPEAYVDPETGYEYIDTQHKVVLTAEDGGEICAVGVDKILYRVISTEEEYCAGHCEEWNPDDEREWIEYTEPFNIPEESCHVIEYKSVDELGNEEEVKWQCVFVDKKPPYIEKELGEPHAFHTPEGEDYAAEFITSETPIYVSVSDQEPHPSGLKEVKYRYTIVDDEYCKEYPEGDDYRCGDAQGNGEWIYPENMEEFEFTIPEESCHLIEIYAEDNVGKSSTHRQCVFVDNSAPEPNKTVGKPKTKWDGKDAYYYDIADKCWSNDPEKFIECWKVTLFTPITLDCIDQEPHPVDHEETCFRVGVDGDDKTEFYCNLIGGIYNKYGDGFCCGMNAPYQFYFNEETEHNLEYYCVDALGNTGPVDEEKFKVEGTSFNITINKKWNLISVPFVMLNDSIDEVFKDIAEDIISVWTYDGETGEWYVYTPDGNPDNDNLHEMKPGWGYWVLARNDTQLVIGGSLFSPAKTPPQKKLVKGWNLIGYYGNTDEDENPILSYDGPEGNGKPAYCALFSLTDTTIGHPRWSALVTYWEPYPYLWEYINVYSRMDPGAGYWIEMDVEDTYVFSTQCWIWP